MRHNKLGHWMIGRNLSGFVQSEKEGRGSLTNIQSTCYKLEVSAPLLAASLID